jgi:hypothetical protein
MKKPNPAEKYPCGPHLRRTGRRVTAFVIVNGEAMCRPCYAGKPIDAIEEGGMFRGKFTGYNGSAYGETTNTRAKPRQHFVSNLRLRHPKPVNA